MDDVTIMIVDDDRAIRESFGDYFEDQGFQTQLMESAEAALSSLLKLPVDVVIVDIRLGGMSGDEFIRRVHACTHRCCFIICTGSPAYQMPDNLLLLQRVSSKIFQKPVSDLSKLQQEILFLIGRFSANVVRHEDI